MFGNASLIVVAETDDEIIAVTRALEGNLTGCLYTANDGADELLYDRVSLILRQKVGRLLNDKMPSNEELVGRSISSENRTATDRSGSIEELEFSHKKM